MTFDEVLAQLRAQRATLVTQRAAQSTIIRDVLAACEADGQRNPTETESQRSEAANTERARLDGEIATLDQRLAPMEAEDAAQRADEAAQAQTRDVLPRGGGVVVSEARTYTEQNDPKGLQFLNDVAADFMGNRQARERLYRHEREEQVERGDQLVRVATGVTTSGAPGLVVPQYLVDMYGPKAQGGRKFADQCRHHDLPATGMTVYIPRQTASTSADEQTTELTAVSETDYDDEMISVSVRTNAGAQTISRQSVERSLGTEDIVFEDLIKSYNSKLDDKLLNATTWGLAAVATVATWTEASPTAAKLYAKVQEAAAGVETALLDLDEGDLMTVMHGRRWAWLKAQTTSAWPFINAGVPGQAMGTDAGAAYPAGVRGHLPDGGAVVTDNHVVTNLGTGTNQDEVYLVAKQEAHLWEDPKAPMFIRAEQTQAKKLGIDLVLYGYFAAIFDRVQDSSKAVHRKLTGTGLVTPTFA